MIRTLRIQPGARLEILEATGWYAQQGTGVAEKFRHALDGAIVRIRDNPFQYQVAYGVLRRARVHQFPYVVIYTVEGSQIVVLGLVHAHRDPRSWHNRK